MASAISAITTPPLAAKLSISNLIESAATFVDPNAPAEFTTVYKRRIGEIDAFWRSSHDGLAAAEVRKAVDVEQFQYKVSS